MCDDEYSRHWYKSNKGGIENYALRRLNYRMGFYDRSKSVDTFESFLQPYNETLDNTSVKYNDFFERQDLDKPAKRALNRNISCNPVGIFTGYRTNVPIPGIVRCPKVNIRCRLYDLSRLCDRNSHYYRFCVTFGTHGYHTAFRQEIEHAMIENCVVERNDSILERVNWLNRASELWLVLRKTTILDRHALNIILSHVLLQESSTEYNESSDIAANTVCVLNSGYEWLWWQHRKLSGKQAFPFEFWQVYFDTRAQNTMAVHSIPLHTPMTYGAIPNVRFDVYVSYPLEVPCLFENSDLVLCYDRAPHVSSSFWDQLAICYAKWADSGSLLCRYSGVRKDKLIESLIDQNRWRHGDKDRSISVGLHFDVHVGTGFLFHIRVLSDKQDDIGEGSEVFDSVSLYITPDANCDRHVLHSCKKLSDLLIAVPDLLVKCPEAYRRESSESVTQEKEEGEAVHKKEKQERSVSQHRWYFLPIDTCLQPKEAMKICKLSDNVKTLNLTRAEGVTLVLHKKNELVSHNCNGSEIGYISLHTYWRHFNILGPHGTDLFF